MEAAGVELFVRDENKEVIEKLRTPQTLNPHKRAFHCTRIAHTKGATLAALHTQKVIHVRMNPSRPLSALRLFGGISRVKALDYFLFADKPRVLGRVVSQFHLDV
jgi:hypothetical protein